MNVQLDLVAEIAEALGEARIRFWLRGGWALDFHLGRITREHADIDLVTWRRHEHRLRRTLEACGWRPVRGDEHVGLDLEKRGQEACFTFIERRGDEIVTRGYESWPWPPGAFTEVPRSLGGVTCLVMAPEALLEEKENYEAFRGRAPRPHDRVSLELLRRLVRREGPGD